MITSGSEPDADLRDGVLRGAESGRSVPHPASISNLEVEVSRHEEETHPWRRLFPGRGSEAQREIFERATCLVLPLFIALALEALVVHFLRLQSSGSAPFHFSYTSLKGNPAAEAAAVAASVGLGIVVFTYVFVGIFTLKGRRTLLALTFVAFCGLNAGLLYWISKELLTRVELAWDWPSLAFIVWNLSAFGALSILCAEWLALGPRYVKAALLAASVALAWPFCCLEEVALWLLVIFMILWDIFAVLAPCGPLGYAMRLDQEHRYMAVEPVLPQGMIYEGSLYDLGLMDFAFYAVIVGRASIVNWPCTAACIIAVEAGVVATIAATPPGATIPALPIALALGIVVYFGTKFTLQPMVITLGEDHVTL